MRLAIVAFAAGVYWLQQQPALPDARSVALWCAALCAVAVLAALRGRNSPPGGPGGFARHRAVLRTASRIAGCAAAALAGAGWSAWVAGQRLSDAIGAEWEGRDVQVIGVVASLPALTERGTRFAFDVESVLTAKAALPAGISLTWYAQAARGEGAGVPAPELRPGQRWRLTVRLRRPHGSANPHGFDFEAWALERGIRATGYVRAGSAPANEAEPCADPAAPALQEVPRSNCLVTAFVPKFSYGVDAMRAAIRDRFVAVLGDAPYRGVLVALAIGDQAGVPRDQWQVYWRTGVGHLVSISGLHITMVASLVYGVVFFGWGRIGALALRVPAQRAAALGGMLAALAYSLIAGFEVPAQRTFFMLAVVASALWAGRATSPSRVLCWALLAVLLLDPWAVLAPGFWLSFGAVAIILHASTARTGRPGAIRSALVTQAAVTLGLLPMLLALFQEVSLVSPLANAFAIPFVSLVIVPVTLLGAVLPVDALLHFAHWLMGLCMVPLAWLAAAPGAVWESHAPPAWTVALAAAGCAWLFLPRGFPARWLGLAWMVPMFTVLPPRPAPGELWMTVLDVGQGLAVSLRTATHDLVYDTGPAWNPDADSGNRIVVPFLRGEGVRRLDGLIVTHEDDDHAGGAISILDSRPTGWLASSLPDDSEILAHAHAPRRCAAGDAWDWDGVRFEMLHPTAASYADRGVKINDRGCTLRIRAAGSTVLLPADIEKRSEAELARREGAALAADVLVAPHHGSKTSSTPVFLEKVRPKLVIFSVGYRNRFRHPHPDVVARYRAAGAALLRTDEAGAVTLKFAAGTWSVAKQRDVAQRYWQDGPRGDADPRVPATSLE